MNLYIAAHVGNGELVGPVKIGVSANPYARLVELQTGSARGIEIAIELNVGDRALAFAFERECHRRLQDRLIQGEWFDVTPAQAVKAMFLATWVIYRHERKLSDEETAVQQARIGVNGAIADALLSDLYDGWHT